MVVQKYPFVEIDKSQDVMQQMTPYIKRNSLELPWDSFFLLDMEFPPTVIPEISWDATVITCYTGKSSCNIEVSADGEIVPRRLVPGRIAVWKPHFPVGLIWYEPITISKCVISLSFLYKVALEAVNRTEIEIANHWWEKEDPLVYHIIGNLIGEMSSGCPHGKVYGESLINTLCVHLICNYTTKKSLINEYKAGLSGSTLKIALEYINDRISENISLAEISTELDISQYHFSRLFKKSTGFTPYQYIIKKRIELSQEMLTRTDKPISDIALEVGFANQSHFSNHFRKIVGVPPKKYRKT
jgi:AraC family transcriptional regulator